MKKRKEDRTLKSMLVKDILKVTNGTLVYGDENEVCENFSKNTKEINEGDIYIGIKGERFDGSTFYKEGLDLWKK